MKESAKLTSREVFASVLGAIIALAGHYFVFQGVAKQADAEMVETLYRQVQDLQRTVFEQQEQIISLRIQLSKKHEAADILRGYLDAMPHPAWIKQAIRSGESVRFVMWHVNPSYEDHFEVSAGRYRGKTDYEIWPSNVADGFYENDLTTLTKMDDYCLDERFPSTPDSTTESGGYVCKWVLALEGGLGVAGQLIPYKLKDRNYD